MSGQPNSVTASVRDSQGIAPGPMSSTRPMYWSVRRELWENRSIFIAPAAVAGLTVVGFLISLFRFPAKMQAASALGPLQQHRFIAQPYSLAAGLMMLTTLVVAIFYCLDALHGERRDRSILFWKSMPLSDLETVLSKMITPVVILPLVAFAAAIATQFMMLLASSAVLLGTGASIATLWAHASLFQTWPMLLYHLLTVHGLWYAPIYAWLLMVSAWARRAPVLWATLPLLAIGVVEKIAFDTSHFGAMLVDRMLGWSRRRLHGRQPFDASSDAFRTEPPPDQPRSVDRAAGGGNIPRRRRAAAPLSRPDLIRRLLCRGSTPRPAEGNDG